MSKRKFKKQYEEIERGLQARMQQALKEQREALKEYEVSLKGVQLPRADQVECFVEQLDIEIVKLAAQRDCTSSMEERADLKAAIVHLRELRARATDGSKRKPPEAGIAVPAVPPKGPLPKQDGAEIPLDFDASKSA
jgi:hypothetical protein